MRIESTRFGEFDVDESRTITFQGGLLGFPNSLTYAVVEIEDSPYLWLQSADEPDVAFLAVTPFVFFPDYELELSDDDERALEVADASQVEVLTVLTVHRSGTEADQITANLLGPIVLNVETRRALQLVLDDDDRYSTRVPLVA